MTPTTGETHPPIPAQAIPSLLTNNIATSRCRHGTGISTSTFVLLPAFLPKHTPYLTGANLDPD